MQDRQQGTRHQQHQFPHMEHALETELVVTIPGRMSFLKRGAIRHVTDGEGRGNHFGIELPVLANAQGQAISGYVVDRLDCAALCLDAGTSFRRRRTARSV